MVNRNEREFLWIAGDEIHATPKELWWSWKCLYGVQNSVMFLSW